MGWFGTFYRFLQYQETREEIIDQARSVGLEIDSVYYLVVLIRSRELDNEEKIYSLMLEMISREKEVEGYGIHLVNNNQNLFVLFGNDADSIERTLIRLLEIEKNHCRDYVITVSDYHTEFDEGSKAYLEADTAFDYRYLVNNSELIRFTAVVKEDYEKLPIENQIQELKYVGIRGLSG